MTTTMLVARSVEVTRWALTQMIAPYCDHCDKGFTCGV